MLDPCEKCEEVLQPFLDRELSDAEYREAETHLDECSYCRKRYRFEETLRMYVRQAFAEEMSPDLKAKLEGALPQHHLVTVDSADRPDAVIADIARIDPDDLGSRQVTCARVVLRDSFGLDRSHRRQDVPERHDVSLGGPSLR